MAPTHLHIGITYNNPASACTHEVEQAVVIKRPVRAVVGPSRGMRRRSAAATAGVALHLSLASPFAAETPLRTSRDYHLLEEVPHDKSSFTQGLTYFDSHVYEGTGLNHKSHIFKHDPANNMDTIRKLPVSEVFGEGISHFFTLSADADGREVREHKLLQLTWKEKIGFIYSLPDMELLTEFTYETKTGEGWGVTFVPHRNEFYVSDGSEYLMVWDALTLQEKRRIRVTFADEPGQPPRPIDYINEIEFVDFAAGESSTCTGEPGGEFTSTMRILANVWFQDVIVAIDPTTGEITRVFDLQDIYPMADRQKDRADVLNGISLTGRLRREEDAGLEVWVTGKLWPKMYRIQLLE